MGWVNHIRDLKYKYKIMVGCIPVSYTHLDVYKRQEDSSVVGEYVTEDGAIFLPNLNAATYVLEEIACPPQYQLNSEKKIVTLEEGKIGQVTFVNKRRPSLEIVKLDSITKSPLAGVTFRISEVDGREIGQFQTDGEGRILVTEDLQDGVRYEVQEVATCLLYTSRCV